MTVFDFWQQCETEVAGAAEMLAVLGIICLSERDKETEPGRLDWSSPEAMCAGLRRFKMKSAVASKFRKQLGAYQNGPYSLVNRWQDHYPKRLFRLYDPPPFLYYRGNLDLASARLWGTIGTRRASPVSMYAAYLFVKSLSPDESGIVSGFARGLDSACHLAALSSGLTNIAVLGCGLDRVYPPENRNLAHRMYESADCLFLSEFLLGTAPAAFHFPRRNRIISALAEELIAWECPVGSGAGITLEAGLEIGQEPYVFFHPMQWNNQGGRRMLKQGMVRPLPFSPGEVVHSPGGKLFGEALSANATENYSYFFAPERKIYYLGADYYLIVSR